ncbi:MAG: ABC transporter ATP-binding protein, partial [Fervidicoccaceae archaeon]
MGEQAVLLDVRNLRKYFGVRGSLFKKVRAVDGVSFQIRRGETFGLVGETGSGKSTLGRTVLMLYEPTSGEIYFDGVNVVKARGKSLKLFRRSAQMVFQDPHTSLTPRMTIAEILLEPLREHGLISGDPEGFLVEHMKSVGLGAEHLYRYPHELSGGQKQRVAILRAVLLRPKFIVLDEPTSSLDVSVQAQILELLRELQSMYNLTYMFISHDIAVVRHMSDRIAVMYLGKIVEIGASEEVFLEPLHPYTQALFSSIPIPDPRLTKSRTKIKLIGEPSSPIDPPPGCRFHPRCPKAVEICRLKEPPEVELGGGR